MGIALLFVSASAGVTVDCSGYCDLAALNSCNYSTLATCMQACASFPTSNQTGNDTLACRFNAVNSGNCAGGAPISSSCVSGPGNGLCDFYCDNLNMTCPMSTNTEEFGVTLAERTRCMHVCGTYPVSSTAATYATAMYPLVAADAGDNLECRLYHLTNAYGDPMTHCPHAAYHGGNVCGSPTVTFCSQYFQVCTGTLMQYTGASSCLSMTASYPSNTTYWGATSDNSIGCRHYHLTLAESGVAADLTTHCPHAGPSGGGVCVSPSTSGALKTLPFVGVLLSIVFLL